MPLPITVLIAAKNERANIATCLDSLKSMERIILLDSHSQDGTPEAAQAHGAAIVQFEYAGGYPKKRQWALEQVPIHTPWVMFMDADESLTAALETEIAAALNKSDASDAYLICKGFHFLKRKFRFGGFSHSAVLLFKIGKAKFEELLEDDSHGLDM